MGWDDFGGWVKDKATDVVKDNIGLAGDGVEWLTDQADSGLHNVGLGTVGDIVDAYGEQEGDLLPSNDDPLKRGDNVISCIAVMWQYRLVKGKPGLALASKLWVRIVYE